jgi:hypothetical protein
MRQIPATAVLLKGRLFFGEECLCVAHPAAHPDSRPGRQSAASPQDAAFVGAGMGRQGNTVILSQPVVADFHENASHAVGGRWT